MAQAVTAKATLKLKCLSGEMFFGKPGDTEKEDFSCERLRPEVSADCGTQLGEQGPQQPGQPE